VYAQQTVFNRVYIPDSSIEKPGDVGVVAHTNHQILVNPQGGLGVSGGMTPAQIKSFYNMPSTGGGGLIAIIDAYDYPAALPDFNTFSAEFGLPKEPSANAAAASNKVFEVVYQGGIRPKATNLGWNQEAALDIQWAHAMAPNAKIVLVEAESSSTSDLFAAIDQATTFGNIKQISMSWGSSEIYSETALDSHFNINGPEFFAAAGDTSGQVLYPAVSPYVVAVGGTHVNTNRAGAFTSETGWTSGGGGNSRYEPKPSWQVDVANTGPRRSVPDISCDGDPNTGICVYAPVNSRGSGWMVVGGTSAATACMAGMANLSGSNFNSTTYMLANIYSFIGSAHLRDITSGNNGWYQCLVGWDFITGVGVPLGTQSL